MFSAIRKLFGTRAEVAPDSPIPAIPVATSSMMRPVPPRPVRAETPVRPGVLPANAPNSLAVPLGSVLDRLPPELKQRVRQMEVGDSHVAIAMQKVLSQIGQGAVRVTFGELRQLAPPGTFTNETDRDRTLVEIPLNEVLARLNPGLLPRRASQKQVSIPAEVTGPFGGQAQVMFTTAPLKAGTPAAPAAPVAYEAPAAPVAPVTPIASMAPVAPIQPTARMQAPVAPAISQRPANSPSPSTQTSFRSLTGKHPAPQPPPQSQPVIPPPQPQPVMAQSQPQPPPVFPPPLAMPTAQPAQPFQPVRPAAPVVARVRATPSIPPATPGAPVAPTRPAVAPQPAAPFWSAPPVAPRPEAEQAFFRKASPTPAVPVAPVAPSQPVYTPIAPEPMEVEEPAPIAMPVLPLTAAPAEPVSTIAPSVPFSPITPITPIAPEVDPEPAPIPFQPPVPAPIPVIEPKIAGETRFLTVSIAELYRAWPESVQQEINDHQMNTSALGLPYGVIEVAMKQGRLAFPWRIIRSWVKPPVYLPSSPHDALVLDLPLKMIAPLFLAELRTSKLQKKISLDENIPDLFSGAPQPEAPSPVVPPVVVAQAPKTAPTPVTPLTKPADTNYFAKNVTEGVEEAPPIVKKGPSPGTAFLVRYATPNEIVSKAAALEGVDGALIALPDGLLVASHIPQSMNADTVAAFLPQIFGRVTQCTKELRLGELNNLNFTVGTTPWKIFKVGAIYFAAFGRAGEPLPSAQLAGIAAELDRKAK